MVALCAPQQPARDFPEVESTHAYCQGDSIMGGRPDPADEIKCVLLSGKIRTELQGE